MSINTIDTSKIFTTTVTKQAIKNELISKLHEHFEKIVDDLLTGIDIETEVRESITDQTFIVISKLKMPKIEEDV